MAYKVQNNSKEVVLFSFFHDNSYRSYALKPGEYRVGDTVGGDIVFADDAQRDQYIQDIFKSGLSITDSNNNNEAVTYDQYKQANP